MYAEKRMLDLNLINLEFRKNCNWSNWFYFGKILGNSFEIFHSSVQVTSILQKRESLL